MAIHEADFPAIRACIFDMDGLLINSEDIITQSTNQLLEKYKRPPFNRSIRAQLMGIPDSTNSDTFHNWAKLPISREQFARESTENMRRHYPICKPLPGAEKILSTLTQARSASSGDRIELALASSTKSRSYELKTSRPETKRLLGFFPPDRRVLGDDPRVRPGRGKPAPDIYLVALQLLNSAAAACGAKPILPHECVVFEDSVIGVEAGRRAGMRVVWVPHPDVAAEYQARQKEVLAGRMDIIEIGEEGQLGELDDGWAESIPSLEHFDYGKYGIDTPP
ncbi:HAD-like domain-containing protein [Aspergillus caelatus]|uniref:HAD-like domain-containing protein n=1 Tax=Aspergillus caelatus TaxID=61420 RepID=A0A5N7A882_9EURO|nr:HAD-like domain-containing protein [Aspergillus caelatus]KAE8364750.1 HAD-like domain-containing protein [Aspergillus caelatus]